MQVSEIRLGSGGEQRSVSVTEIKLPDCKTVQQSIQNGKLRDAIGHMAQDGSRLLSAAKGQGELPSEFFMPDLNEFKADLDSVGGTEVWESGEIIQALAQACYGREGHKGRRNDVAGTIYSSK